MNVFILTIQDMANFQKLEHSSVWASHRGARLHAASVVADLVERDKHHGLGDTFHVEIRDRVVQGIPVRPVVGRYYMMRNGIVVGPLIAAASFNGYTAPHEVDEMTPFWSANGESRFLGEKIGTTDPQYDLVEEFYPD